MKSSRSRTVHPNGIASLQYSGSKIFGRVSRNTVHPNGKQENNQAVKAANSSEKEKPDLIR